MEYTGLNGYEAKALLKQIGPNKITDLAGFSFFGLLFAETFNFPNILLVLAAGISFFIGDYTDGGLIIAIVALNTAISIWQEYKAEKTLEELKNLTFSYVRTLRDGKIISLNSEELVPGDLLMLELGDKIPSDGLVLESVNLEVNESSLTGEAEPVAKDAASAGRNSVFAGTLVTAGRGTIKVSSTGENTRFGKVAQTLETIKEQETPLQKEIKNLTINIAVIALVFSTFIFMAGISLNHGKIPSFLTAVSAAVAAIPEGLPAIILITLAVGVKKMAIQRAVVRKMIAVETLGSINVICTDKTGTLTSGEMRVSDIWFDYKILDPEKFLRQKNHPYIQKFIDAMVIPNTANLVRKFDHGSRVVLGDSTEGALLLFAQYLGIDYELHRNQVKILAEFPFDQNKKTMSMVVERDDQVYALVKSSPEFIVNFASRIYQGGKIHLLTENDKIGLTSEFELLTSKGYRVFGFGYKNNLKKQPSYSRQDAESDIVILGFVAFSDPVREEVKKSLDQASQAGIKTIMITGDNELTAMSIATQLKLAREGDEVITGQELSRMNDEDLLRIIENVRVFARTNPEDKLRIVKAFQTKGLAVAVTGDGVNDALALKQAEIGVAMGKKGTDVAKEAADIVITDDNYSTIVKAVEEGRNIYNNVLKSIRYLISTNISELFTILFALLMKLPAPLLPAQILWINLVSDGLPAIALALDPKDPSVMNQPPRPKEHKLLSFSSASFLVLIGIVVGLIALIFYWKILQVSKDLTLARTWTFNVLIMLQMIVAFLIRGRKQGYNTRLVMAVAITIILQAIINFVPYFYPIFKIKNPF